VNLAPSLAERVVLPTDGTGVFSLNAQLKAWADRQLRPILSDSRDLVDGNLNAIYLAAYDFSLGAGGCDVSIRGGVFSTLAN